MASHRCTCLMEEGLCRRPCPHQHRLHPQQAHWVCRVRGGAESHSLGAPCSNDRCLLSVGLRMSLYHSMLPLQCRADNAALSSLSIFPLLKTILMKSFKRMWIREKTTITCLHMQSGNIHTCDFRLPGSK